MCVTRWDIWHVSVELDRQKAQDREEVVPSEVVRTHKEQEVKYSVVEVEYRHSKV